MIRTLRRGTNGDSDIWWSWQNLSSQYKPGKWPKSGRAWLHWYRNCFEVSWTLFGRSCGIGITFSSTDDHAITLYLAIPFLFALWFSLDRLPIVARLPGVKWTGKYGSGEREIQARIFANALWLDFWTYPGGDGHGWHKVIHFDDILLGRAKYSKRVTGLHHSYVVMPEGVYPASIEFNLSTWKRPRWPWAKTLKRAEIEIEGGVPVPGKGENSYDCGDDAIHSMSCIASTVREATKAVYESAMRDRVRYAAANWKPADGWPEHCLQEWPE